MLQMNMRYFEDLRDKINRRLDELETLHREEQKNEFPWLYGALGAVPSDVMFICENPSLTGVAKAHVDTIDDCDRDIERQWWDGPKSSCRKRFRPVLCQMGLKTSQPDALGGWNCYITNVVKEANFAGEDQRKKTPQQRREQARDWAGILRWEWEQVRPQHVFCVGEASFEAVKRLQRDGLLPVFKPVPMWHYSARGRDADIKQRMLLPLREALISGT